MSREKVLPHHSLLFAAHVAFVLGDQAPVEKFEQRVIHEAHAHPSARLHHAGEHEGLAVADARCHGRVLALEVLMRTEAVASCIRDGKTFMLPGVMQTGGKMGMRLMDDSLLELFNEGLITNEECYQRSEQKAVMRQHLLAG